MADKTISKKQTYINLFANVISYSANILISFVLTPYLINNLGKETYSFYPMANTIVSYMSVLTNSMNAMASRFVTVSLVKLKNDKANCYFSSAFFANVIMSLILLIPMTIIIVFLDKLMNVPINSVSAIKSLYILVFVTAIINILSTVLGIATFAKNRIDLRSLREIITAVIRIILYIVFYKFFSPSIVYIGIVALIIAIINMFFQYCYTKKLLPEINLKYNYVCWDCTKELLFSSIWNAINTFGNTLLAGMTLIMANILYNANDSGSLSIVQTVPQFISGIISMLVGVFFPIITYKYAQNDRNGMLNEIRYAQNVVGVFGCSVITVFSALSKSFFALWTPNENAYDLAFLSLVTIIPHLFIACLWPLTNVNIVMNKLKVPACFTLFFGILNIIIALCARCFFNAPVYMLPIVSSFLQVLWIGIFIPIYVSHNLNVKCKYFYAPVIRIVLTCVLLYLLIRIIVKYLFIDNWFSLLLHGVILGLFSIIVLSCVSMGYKSLVGFIKRFFKVK